MKIDRRICWALGLGWALAGCGGAIGGEKRAEDGEPSAHGAHEEGEEEHGEGDGHGEHGEGEDHGEEGVVRLSPGAIERGGIEIGQARAGTLSGSLAVPAEVQLNANQAAHVAPLVAGQLREVHVGLGERVAVGQPLVVLRSVALGQARAELQRARAMLEVARANLKRQERLRKEGITSERAYLDAKFEVARARAEQDAARARLRVFGLRGGSGPDMELRSPIAGVVVERHATFGETVDPENTLFLVADLSTVWVMGRVYEQHIGGVREQMAATLTLPAYPGRLWRGTVDYVANTLDEDTRTLAVRVEIENPDETLRPGLFGTLRLLPGGEDPQGKPGARVTVAEGAVQTVKGRTVVFVPGDEPGEFRVQDVTLGMRTEGEVEVLEGLAPEAPVVVQGAFILKSQLIRSELAHEH